MNNKEIEFLLLSELNLEKVFVTGDQKHINIIAVGDIFKKANPVQRQQIVYKPLINMILEQHIHAISIKSYTLTEWKNNKNFNN